jgi:phosphoribosylformimino-5-aminoimidazole carboxamide ribonucleotide (ProFAR) isomerase
VILYPAIDIKNGAAVRLVQGDMARETRYDDHPENAARRWVSEGASWLHVVDLDGAVAGEPRNLDAIRAFSICRSRSGRRRIRRWRRRGAFDPRAAWCRHGGALGA